jgi:predicted lipoprotein with Yx(FWY)xxD motif
MGTSEMRRHHRPAGRKRIGRAAGILVGTLLAALVLLPGTAAAISYPPTVSPAVQAAGGFELKGTVYDYSGTTTYHFEYGTSTAYGSSAPIPDADASSGLFTPVSQLVTGLAPNTTYHYRLVSTNSLEGTLTSADETFSTAVSTPTPPPSPGPGTPPGKTPVTPPGKSPTPTTPGEATGPYPYPSQPSGPGSTAPAVGGSGPKQVAKALSSKGRMLLATTKGRTLYTLSAEGHGKFICTEMSGCTSIWIPLTVATGVVPQGPVKLGTVHRPEGTVQVTFRGRPLYTYAADKKPGQAKGEGLKDVGTWHAALVPTKRPQPLELGDQRVQ